LNEDRAATALFHYCEQYTKLITERELDDLWYAIRWECEHNINKLAKASVTHTNLMKYMQRSMRFVEGYENASWLFEYDSWKYYGNAQECKTFLTKKGKIQKRL